MKEFVLKLLMNESTISSARFINVAGFFTATILMVQDTVMRGMLDNMNFMAYLAYCGGVYGLSKGLDKLQGGKKDADNNA